MKITRKEITNEYNKIVHSNYQINGLNILKWSINFYFYGVTYDTIVNEI